MADRPMKPLVSVVIPCRNDAQFLDQCLQSVLDSDYRRLEVIVADGMSQDGTRDLVERHAKGDKRVRRIENPRRTTPHALNRAIAASRGDLILRLDSRAEIAPDYIARAVEELVSSDADCVGGAMRTAATGSGPFAKPIVIALSSFFGVGNAHFRIGRGTSLWVDTVFGACWRREVFERIGRFDERLERSQDIEFSSRLCRAGGKILMSPKMQIRYHARATLKEFWRHNWTNGVWAILPFAHVRGMAVRWRHLTPLALVLGISSSITVGACTGIGWVSCSLALAYLAVNLAASVRIAVKHRSVALVILMPVVFASLHLAYGAGSVWGCVRLALLLIQARTQQPQPAETTI